MEILYTAYFVDDVEALKILFPPVHKTAHYGHCTIAFKPSNLEGIEVGAITTIKVIGIVADDNCQALIVEAPKSTRPIPHITLSCAEGIAPFYANQLCATGDIFYFVTPVTIQVTEDVKYSN